MPSDSCSRALEAYWEFEEADHWLGFSPKVSVLLEAAYQNWLQNPSAAGPFVSSASWDEEVRSQIQANGFLYNVNYSSLLEEGQRQSQRIRRVGVPGRFEARIDGSKVTADTREKNKARFRWCSMKSMAKMHHK